MNEWNVISVIYSRNKIKMWKEIKKKEIFIISRVSAGYDKSKQIMRSGTVQFAINVLEIIGLLLIGIVSIDTYGSKRRIKPQIAFGLLVLAVLAGLSFLISLVLLILNII